MKVRGGRAAGGTNVADDVSLFDDGAFGHGELGHVQVDGFETLAVIDTDGAAVQIPVMHDLDDACVDRVDGSAGGRALIEAAMEIAGGFTVHVALHAEGRGHAAAYRQFQRFRPVAHFRDGAAKLVDGFGFSG